MLAAAAAAVAAGASPLASPLPSSSSAGGTPAGLPPPHSVGTLVMLEIGVEDGGRGMTKEQTETMFEPYERCTTEQARACCVPLSSLSGD